MFSRIQMARVIIWLADRLGDVSMPEDVNDCIEWSRTCVRMVDEGQGDTEGEDVGGM